MTALSIAEIDQLISSYNFLVSKTNELIGMSMLQTKKIAIAEIATQVAHDIRSPMAALESVEKDLIALPEEKRLIIRSALGRIKDIANELLEKNRQTTVSSRKLNSNDGDVSVQLLSAVVEELITEKRLQFRTKFGVQIGMSHTVLSYGQFARISASALKRILSNLINNAVEALKSSGTVQIALVDKNSHVQIQIIDDGKGIPADILPSLMQKGVSHNKTGGSGLGLFHARSVIEEWGGTVAISSMLGKGASVTIELSKSETPNWFALEIVIRKNAKVIVLDDDSSIHQIWKDRLESLRAYESGVEIIHCSTADEFLQTCHGEKSKNFTALVDYELLGELKSGLDLIEELGIAANCILVTSRFEEQSIRERSERLGVRIIPKGLAGFVPMEITTEKASEVDAILIDDDSLIHMTWKTVANSAGKSIRCFSTPDEFFRCFAVFDLVTPVYVDSKLGDGVKGEEVAKKINELGFKNTYLTTGYSPDSFEPMTWITAIVGKDPPWSL